MLGATLVVALAATSPAAEAERIAAAAVQMAAAQPQEAYAQARRALALTADFDPIAYVTAGRKGEVVEDQYLAARGEYRRHRAKLYEAAGEALFRSGKSAEAARYFRRAVDLDPRTTAIPRLARALVALNRGREALDVQLVGLGAALNPTGVDALAEAADAARIPSLQVEIDRVRALALPVPKPEFRDGLFPLPERARLSTGEPFRFSSEGLTLLYVADTSCRSCSGDLEALKRLAPTSARIVIMPAVPDQDQALRSVMSLYRYRWPYAVGAGSAKSLDLPASGLFAVGRHGFAGLVITAPFVATLPPVLELLARKDVAEAIPRGAWNHALVERKPAPPRPGLLPNGFAPGEDEPAPDAFSAAVAAYDAGKPADALRLVDQLDADGGWLLSPEARFDRALCLAALGRREEARKLLLHTGDSRFQEDLDRALERVGSPRKPES